MTRRAFTLIELLVVVTIIVILLALLTPAIDKAIYQAQLAVCGARIRTLAEAATIYATEHRRAYPYNDGVYKAKSWRPLMVWVANGSNPPFDNRPMIRPYVSSINKQFQDPFLTEVDIDLPDVDQRYAGVTGWASYQYWFGWRYAHEKGMIKLGDRFTYTAGGEQHAFDLLANDWDQISPPQNDNQSIGSHPDKEPSLRWQQITSMRPYAGGVAVASEPTYEPHIQSRWYGFYLPMRGPIDMNFAHADCSVSRDVDVVVQQADGDPDPRMVRVPEYDDDINPVWRIHLPPVGGQ